MPHGRHVRRTFLRVGTIAALGSGLPGFLRGRAHASPRGRDEAAGGGGRARSCILLYGTGGPAQQETFDPKPDAADGCRGEFSAIETSVAGIRICEHLPMLARGAHRYAILRSVHHESSTHGVGVHYNLTGLKHAPRPRGEPQMSRRDPPCIGAVIRQARGDRNDLPASVQLPVRIGDQNNFQWAGQNGGFLGPKYDPLMLIDEGWMPGTLLPSFVPSPRIAGHRLNERTRLLESLESLRADRRDGATRSFGRFQTQALEILSSRSNSWKAFCLDDEKPATLERYGDNKFGRSCLVARRLVEAGVGLVTVPWMYLKSTRNFDTHAKHFQVMKDVLLPPLDRAFSALLEDLDQRGLLDDTLVAWTGEFGRTPKINKKAGRDHWGGVYSTVLAGAGVRGGQVWGASDRKGAAPVDAPLHVPDFVATIYHALGYSSETVVHDVGGRPHHIVQGEPLLKLF